MAPFVYEFLLAFHITMTLSYIFSDIKRDICWKSPLFVPFAFGFPSEYCPKVWYGKTRMVWLPDGKKIENTFSCFDTIHERDRQTDRRSVTRPPTGTAAYKAAASGCRPVRGSTCCWKRLPTKCPALAIYEWLSQSLNGPPYACHQPTTALLQLYLPRLTRRQASHVASMVYVRTAELWLGPITAPRMIGSLNICRAVSLRSALDSITANENRKQTKYPSIQD